MASGPSALLQQQQQLMNQNVCEKHFPEPIIYMGEQPLCKKCILSYTEEMQKKARAARPKGAQQQKESKEDRQA